MIKLWTILMLQQLHLFLYPHLYHYFQIMVMIKKSFKFLCPWPRCDKKFLKIGKYNEHEKIFHLEQKNKCKKIGCGKSFFSKGGLYKHKKINIHNNWFWYIQFRNMDHNQRNQLFQIQRNLLQIQHQIIDDHHESCCRNHYHFSYCSTMVPTISRWQFYEYDVLKTLEEFDNLYTSQQNFWDKLSIATNT